MTSAATDHPPVARFEWALLALLLVIGFALRAAYPSRLAVEHFDEGVYASNLYFDAEDGYAYPSRHLYAPPLVPWLLEWSISLFGPGVVGCFGLGIVTGTLTIAAVWWVARSWFGPVAALSAATLLAFSGPHIAFSRTCLTDVPMGLWWTLSLGLLSEATHRGNRTWAVAAGVAVALAWWTKYNGWLPLAISFAGIVTWLTFCRPGWQVARRSLGCWAIAAVTAFVLWSPVLWGLQDKGGYAAVAANHARYFHGLPGWWGAFRQQAGNLELLESPFAAGALIGAVAIPCFYFSRPEDGSDMILTVETGIFRFAACLGLAGLFFARGKFVLGYVPLALVGLAIGAAAIARGVKIPAPRRRDALLLGASWIAAMIVLTPLYRAYPRLSLPLLIGACLAAAMTPAAAFCRFDEPSIDAPSRPTDRLQTALALIALVSVVGVLISLLGEKDRTIWPERSGPTVATRELRDAARSDATKRSRKSDCVVYIYAEPAVFFHLSAADQLSGPVSDLEFAAPGSKRMPMPTYLVVGPHARRTDRFADQWAARGDRFEKVGEWSYQPSLVVLLDHYRPEEVPDPDKRPAETIELYRLR